MAQPLVTLGRYPFCLFRIPDEGGRVLWQITNICNYQCPYCIFASGPGKIKGELDTAEALQTIDGLFEHNFRFIKFTGGEPFVRKDMTEILEYACEKGIDADVSTNASLITAERAIRLRRSGLKMIHVSVDGHSKEIHEAARGKGTYDGTIKGLNNLVRSGMYVRVGCIIFEKNQYFLREMVEFCFAAGASEVVFSIMEPAGRIKNDFSTVATRSITELGGELHNLRPQYSERLKVSYNFEGAVRGTSCETCPGGTKFLYIDNLGRVSPCTWIVEHAPKYRSDMTLKESSLETILRSEPLEQYQTMIKSAHCAGRGGCPLHWERADAA